MQKKAVFVAEKFGYMPKKQYLCGGEWFNAVKNNLRRKEDNMQTAQTQMTEQRQATCSLHDAMEDISLGRINHYSSLDELIRKFE